MARRKGRGPNKAGTIYQDKHGQWWAQLAADEYRKRPKRRATSEQEALVKLREMEKERTQGLTPSDQDPTLAHFLTNWLEISVRPNVRQSTYENRVWFVEHYLLPAIGTIRLRKLTAARVQQMLNDLIDQGLARGTVQMVRRRLITALNIAIEWKLLPPGENPARHTKIAGESTDGEEGDPLHRLTATQAQTLLISLEGHRLFGLYFLALAYGMRQAELIGLRWTDVDLEGREIRIRTQVHRKKKEIRRTKPKTKSSRRALLVDDATVAVLKTQAQRVHEERDFQQRKGKWKDHGLVFPSENGTPLYGSAVWRHFQNTLGRAHLPAIPFHGLRHTAASVMLENGVMLADVSEILGHANPAITARLYLKGTDDGKRAAAETMTTLLRRAQ